MQITTIRNKTARELMYAWHSGQCSPFYAAASSGLVENWEALLYECESMKNNPDNPQDYQKLVEWIKHKQSKAKFKIVVCGSSYFVLPWISRSY